MEGYMSKKFLYLVLFAAALAVSAAENVKLMIPEVIYAVPGVEMNVYFNNIVTVINPANYVFDVTCPKGRNDLKRWRFTPTDKDVGTYKWAIEVIGMNGVIASAETKLVVLPKNAGEGKKLTMLIIGASQTMEGFYPLRLARLMSAPGNPELKLIGSKQRNIARHEGYGGWKWDTFLTRYKPAPKKNADGMHPDRPVGFSSPFLFPGKDGKPVFDLDRYFKIHNDGKVPDIVSFQLGINDIFKCTEKNIAEGTAKSLENMELLVNKFRELKPAPQIVIFQHIPGAGQDAFGRAYKCGRTTWQFRNNLDYYNRALLKKAKSMNLTVIPAYINIDTEHNFSIKEEEINEGNTRKIFRQRDGLHPVPAGYYQMGDTLYCHLKALISKMK